MRKKSIAGVVALLVLFSIMFAGAAAASPFPDVAPDHWAYDSIVQLAAVGLVEGYPDGTYGGDRTLTRYESAMVFARTLHRLGILIEAGIEDQVAALDNEIREIQLQLAEAITAYHLTDLEEGQEELKRQLWAVEAESAESVEHLEAEMLTLLAELWQEVDELRLAQAAADETIDGLDDAVKGLSDEQQAILQQLWALDVQLEAMVEELEVAILRALAVLWDEVDAIALEQDAAAVVIEQLIAEQSDILQQLWRLDAELELAVEQLEMAMLQSLAVLWDEVEEISADQMAAVSAVERLAAAQERTLQRVAQLEEELAVALAALEAATMDAVAALSGDMDDMVWDQAAMLTQLAEEQKEILAKLDTVESVLGDSLAELDAAVAEALALVWDELELLSAEQAASATLVQELMAEQAQILQQVLGLGVDLEAAVEELEAASLSALAVLWDEVDELSVASQEAFAWLEQLAADQEAAAVFMEKLLADQEAALSFIEDLAAEQAVASALITELAEDQEAAMALIAGLAADQEAAVELAAQLVADQEAAAEARQQLAADQGQILRKALEVEIGLEEAVEQLEMALLSALAVLWDEVDDMSADQEAAAARIEQLAADQNQILRKALEVEIGLEEAVEQLEMALLSALAVLWDEVDDMSVEQEVAVAKIEQLAADQSQILRKALEVEIGLEEAVEQLEMALLSALAVLWDEVDDMSVEQMATAQVIEQMIADRNHLLRQVLSVEIGLEEAVEELELALLSALAVLWDEVDDVAADVHALRADASAVEARVAMLESVLPELYAAADQSEAIAAAVAELEAELDEKLVALDGKLQQLAFNLEALQANMDAMGSSLADVDQKVDQLAMEIEVDMDSLSAELAEGLQQLEAGLGAEIAAMAAELATVDAGLETLDSQVTALDVRVGTLATAVEAVDARVDSLVAEVDAEISALADQVGLLETDGEALEERLTAAERVSFGGVLAFNGFLSEVQPADANSFFGFGPLYETDREQYQTMNGHMAVQVSDSLLVTAHVMADGSASDVINLFTDARYRIVGENEDSFLRRFAAGDLYQLGTDEELLQDLNHRFGPRMMVEPPEHALMADLAVGPATGSVILGGDVLGLAAKAPISEAISAKAGYTLEYDSGFMIVENVAMAGLFGNLIGIDYDVSVAIDGVTAVDNEMIDVSVATNLSGINLGFDWSRAGDNFGIADLAATQFIDNAQTAVAFAANANLAGIEIGADFYNETDSAGVELISGYMAQAGFDTNVLVPLEVKGEFAAIVAGALDTTYSKVQIASPEILRFGPAVRLGAGFTLYDGFLSGDWRNPANWNALSAGVVNADLNFADWFDSGHLDVNYGLQVALPFGNMANDWSMELSHAVDARYSLSDSVSFDFGYRRVNWSDLVANVDYLVNKATAAIEFRF